MNVLEAMDKLDKLNNQVKALNVAIGKLELDRDFRSELHYLNNIKNDFEKQATELKSLLEKTPLVTTR